MRIKKKTYLRERKVEGESATDKEREGGGGGRE